MKMNGIVVLSLLLKLAVSQNQIPNADDQLHIYALPVGQGDCTVIQCPRANGDPVNDKGVVSIIDAGSRTAGVGIDGQGIVDYLAGTRLQYVFLTHADADHLNYMDDILNYYGGQMNQQFPVLHPCTWNKYGCYINSEHAVSIIVPPCFNIASCREALFRLFNIRDLNLCPNYQPNINEANSVKLSFVASAYKGCVGHKANNGDSLIVKITYAGRSTLITGDFELPWNSNDGINMENFLLGVGNDLRSDIYKLSHHGSYNDEANQLEFLNAVGARAVFSSSGYLYGHPRCDIYNYYNARLQDNAVDEHIYTCFNRNNNHRYVPSIIRTTRAIYVTSALWGNVDGWAQTYNTVVEFNIYGNNNVDVQLYPLGNDVQNMKRYPQ